MASEHPVTSFSSTTHNPEQYNGFVFWNPSTECLRNIRNIVQTFVKQVLLVLLRVEEDEEASVRLFDFPLIRRQKYSLCWFTQCSRAPSLKSLCANVDPRSHCNQSRINWTGLSKCACFLRLKAHHYRSVCDAKRTLRGTIVNSAESQSHVHSEQMRLPACRLFATWLTTAPHASAVLAACVAQCPRTPLGPTGAAGSDFIAAII